MKNFLYFFITLLTIQNLSAADKEWIGSQSQSWADPANWSPVGVPTAEDHVTISAGLNQTVIPADVNAVAGSVVVENGRSLSVNLNATLTLYATNGLPIDGRAGLLNRGSVTNLGRIRILDTEGTMRRYGIFNEGTLTNAAGAEIEIDKADVAGVRNESGSIENYGQITIGNTTGGWQYSVHNKASFLNHATGSVVADRSLIAGVGNESGTFTNAGSLVLGSNTTGEYGIENDSDFFNNSGGAIHIDRSTSIGVRNLSGAFTNEGNLIIGAEESVGSVGVDNHATFINNSGGLVTIDRSSSTGFDNKLPEATLTNEGRIAIGDTHAVGGSAIFNASTVHNKTGGVLTLSKWTDRGIFNAGVFTNEGNMTLGAAGSTGAIAIYSIREFNNTGCQALLHLVSNANIIAYGMFRNAGTIIENSSGASASISNSGLIQNLNGGSIDLALNTGVVTTDASHIWKGCTSTDWATGSNWSYGKVPTSADNVVIPGSLPNQPVIAAGTTAAAFSVEVQTGATLKIENTAVLTVTGSKMMEADNIISLYNAGTVENEGIISIDITAAGGAYLGLVNRGLFQNKLSAELLIDKPLVAGLVNNAGTFYNEGKITVGATSGGELGIANAATFTNSGGAISINNVLSHGLYNMQGTFTNAAKIEVGNEGAAGEFGLLNITSFDNQENGEIYITNASGIGLHNGVDTSLDAAGIFTNSGTITLGTADSGGSIGLQNDAGFNNLGGGSIKIDQSASHGLHNKTTGSFINAGGIAIGAAGGERSYGLYNDGQFENEGNADITVDGTSLAAVYQNGGTFTNTARISIGSIAGVGAVGLHNSAEFENTGDGDIRIDRPTGVGLNNAPAGSLVNSARIVIVDSGTENENALINDGSLENNSCGVVILLGGNFLNYSGSSTTNSGLVQIAEELNNQGTFSNNGVLKYATLSGSVTNSQVIVSNTPEPIFTYGGNYNGAVDGIFKDEDGDEVAGVFTAPATFTPDGSLPQGEQNLYAKITLTGETCSYLVPFIYANAVATAIWTGAVDIDWDKPGNWNPAIVPTSSLHVVIPEEPAHQPTIGTGTSALAKSVIVNSGAVLTISTASGLTVTGATQGTGVSVFYNEGTVNSSGSLVLDGLGQMMNGFHNKGIFQQDVNAELNIDKVFPAGILNETGSFTSSGRIIIGTNSGPTYGVFNSALFSNGAGGTIEITNATDAGLSNRFGGVFNNEGELSIRGSDIGIYNNVGQLNNLAGGQITVSQSNVNELLNSGTFNNEGKIAAGAEGGQTAIVFHNLSSFHNRSGGELLIHLTTAEGLVNDLNLVNDGEIRIKGEDGAENGRKAQVNVIENGIINRSSFVNNVCAKLLVLAGTLLNEAPAGIFTNLGLVQVTGLLQNNGVFTNRGVLKYGSISGTITNEQLIVRDSPTPIFIYGNNVFNGVINGIYTSDDLSEEAGSFEMPNSFVPDESLPQGTYTFYISITPEGSTCEFIVPFIYQIGAFPVKLVSFTGRRTPENENLLTWVTAEELNFDHFEIQRTEDGRTFTTIGTKSGQRSANGAEVMSGASYQFVDAATPGHVYYRLKMVDRDATFEYSPLVSIEGTKGNELIGKGYPNPTSEAAFVELNPTIPQQWTISVTDLSGRVLHAQTRNLSAGRQIIRLDHLTQGMNLIRFDNGVSTEVRRLVRD